MTCKHFTAPNACAVMVRPIDSPRVCFHCGQNTAKGQWPTRESLPVVSVIRPPVGSAPRDPGVRAAIARQQAGCTGCGDTPLAGI